MIRYLLPLLIAASATAVNGQVSSRPVCLGDSAFALGPVRIGEEGSTALVHLDSALEIRRDTLEGADLLFPLTHYRYHDFELTISRASGKVAAIRALGPDVHTPLGLHLGMSRASLESSVPPGALRATGPSTAEICGRGLATSMTLAFDSTGRVVELILYGYYPKQ